MKMFQSYQSSFGSLTKSKKKKKKNKKNKNKGSTPSSHPINGFHRSDANQILSEPDGDGKDAFSNLPQEDVRFVLPRQSNSSSSKLIPFLLPGQKQLLNTKDDVPQNDEGTQLLEVSTTNNVDESIDDIFGHSTKKKTKSKEATVAPKLKAGDKETSSEKSKDSKKQDSEQKCNEKSKPNSNLKNEGETKNGVNQTEESNDKMILARSVQDAVNDKVGRRPRANSTDGELNLPQHGLCNERSVQLSHRWDLNRLYNCNGSKVAPPRGLVNLGNSCFMNATLQCLVYMPSFCQSIMDLPPSCYDSKNGGTLRHGQRITMMMRSLLRIAHGITQREKNEPPKTNAFAPKTIFKAITSCRINGHRFRAGRQEDAHELLGK